jgi:DNA-binding NarL/FixJ family response regulator
MSPIILLADKQAVVIDGLRWVLRTEFGTSAIYETSTLSDIMVLFKKKRPTHLITDLDFSDGNAFEIIPNILSLYRKTKIMVLTTQELSLYSSTFKRYGIRHFISKNTGRPDLKRMLTTFLYDVTPIFIPDPTDAEFSNPFDALTPREKIAALHIMRGLGSNEIGLLMGLKQNTISTYKSRIFEKLRVNYIGELIQLYNLHESVLM